MSSVDVIVPCYNYGKYLRECVRSVLTQEGVQVRVLVLDDASQDDSAAVATALALEDPRVTFVRHEHNHGHIATYNEGIAWASADALLLISADDYVLPGALSRAARALANDPFAAFVVGSVVELEPDGHRTTVTPEPLLDGAMTRTLDGAHFIAVSGTRNFVATPSVLVRTRLQKEVGGYRPELPHTGDMEMWLRLAAYGSVVVLREPQAVWRRHARNMSHGYNSRSRLPELHQKQAAVDAFLMACMPKLSDPIGLRMGMMHSLAEEAIGCASAAFNTGDLALVDEIVSYGLELNPQVTSTAAWRRLAWKRRLGVRAWNLIAPAHRRVAALSRGGAAPYY